MSRLADGTGNRLTPDRLLLGLLAVEGFLLLSERFGWFAFNQHKGWTVLIAVTGVALAVVLLLVWIAASLLFRRRLQFGVRSLLVLVVAVAVACSWLAVEIQRARKQNEATQWIADAGGSVLYDWEDGLGSPPPGPDWLRNRVGVDFLGRVVAAYLHGKQVTDDGMKHVRGVPHLRTLNLGGTQVTDEGLRHLRGNTRLNWLGLADTQVTDAGLEHLRGLYQLWGLDLAGTQVTAAGVERLRQALPNCYIMR